MSSKKRQGKEHPNLHPYQLEAGAPSRCRRELMAAKEGEGRRMDEHPLEIKSKV